MPQQYSALLGPHARKLKPGVTAVMTVFKRGAAFAKQLAALDGSSLKPSQIFVWQTGDHADVSATIRGRTDVGHLHVRGHDFMYHGRFLPTLMADTEFTCVFDDDTIPQANFIQAAIDAIRARGLRTVTGTTGRIANFKHAAARANYSLPGKRRFVHDTFVAGRPHDRPRDGDEVLDPFQVDFVIHSYCFHTALARSFWALPHYTWANGEDIAFGAALQIAANATFVVPRQMWGQSTMGDSEPKLGGDDVASYKRSGHQEIRSELVHHWVGMGWRPLRLPRDGFLDPADFGMSTGPWPADGFDGGDDENGGAVR